MHAAIKRVTEDLESFKFNTAISALMELRTAIEKALPSVSAAAARESIEALIQLLGPLAPHFCEEMWERTGHPQLLARQPWPRYDASLLERSEVALVVQVNGKVRTRLTVPVGIAEEALKSRVLQDPVVAKWLEGKQAREIIIVPNRLVNVVT